jgi:hypothetical protein
VLLYLSLFSRPLLFYEKKFYEDISGIQIPASSTVIESYDNGEYYTATSFKLERNTITPFILAYNFQAIDSRWKPRFFGETGFKKERINISIDGLYNSGTKGKNSWVYLIDTSRGILWAEIQYPDWGGD